MLAQILFTALLATRLVLGAPQAVAIPPQISTCPATLGFGETANCSITSPGETDTYTFDAGTGDKVLVRMSKASGNLWPGVKIYGPDGITQLCNASSSVTAEIATCTLSGAGTFTLLAYDSFDGTYTGDYYIHLQRLNNPGNPLPIAFGQTLSGVILTPAEMDAYTFAAEAGDKVLARMSKSSGNLWPGIRLYDPNGAKVCENGGSVTAEIATCTLNSTGTYTLLAYDSFDGTYTGDYYVHIQRLNNPGSSVPITFGQTLSGSILTPAEMDAYTFTAETGDKVLVRMSKASGNLWPGVKLYGPDGAKLCNTSSSVTAEIATCTLSSAGTYTLLAYDSFDGTHTGDYYVHVQRLNNPGSPVPITFGQTLSGSILTPAEMDAYTFSAETGDKVLVRMSKASGNLWPGVNLYGPDGAKLCNSSSSVTAEIATCTLFSTGTFTLLVYDSFDGTYTGDYYLHLQRLNNPGSPVPIAFGQTFSGATLTPAEMDAYTFTAEAGDKVLARMSKSSGNLWPGIRLYDPNGAKVCEDGGSVTAEIATCTLNSTGTYTLLAYDSFDGTYTGAYYIHMQRLNNPGSSAPITFGQTLSGSTLTPAEMNAYTLTAEAGDNILARASKASGNLWPGMRIYASNGLKVCENGGSTTSEISNCTLVNAGTYTLLVFDDFDGTYTGDYYLFVQRLNNPANSVPIVLDQTLTASISTPAEMDTYTFTAVEGDQSPPIRMNKLSGSLWPGIRLYGPDGFSLYEAYGSTTAEIASFILPSTGTYTILAGDGFDGTDTGDYSIRYGNTEQKSYSIAAQDGWVLESSAGSRKGGSLNAISKYFQLGDEARNRQYKAILSFNTMLPTGAVIKSVTLRIKQYGKPVGSSPFSVLGNLLVDVKKGSFGKINLEITDFQMLASANKVSTFGRTATAGWYTANLNAAGIGKINRTGVTQFRLYFTKGNNGNSRADYLKFFSGNNATGKPELVITYTVP